LYSEPIPSLHNPQNFTTEIHREGTQDADIFLAVHDAAGRLVRRLEIGKRSRAVIWDGKDMNGKDVGSGVYFVKVSSGHQVPPEKLVLIR
jgi:flagellar hook assembly protein FlgD